MQCIALVCFGHYGVVWPRHRNIDYLTTHLGYYITMTALQQRLYHARISHNDYKCLQIQESESIGRCRHGALPMVVYTPTCRMSHQLVLVIACSVVSRRHHGHDLLATANVPVTSTAAGHFCILKPMLSLPGLDCVPCALNKANTFVVLACPGDVGNSPHTASECAFKTAGIVQAFSKLKAPVKT